ncbi:DMT family transporter [Metabacillus sp. 84]|uniref:DMT family transporter n=1 Tax=Metabacillus sp. 84 TaxID=3404705 RepID=UPI003CF17440
MPENDRRLPFQLLALAAVALWGISFVSSKALLQNLDPYTIVASRFGLAAVLLGSICFLFRISIAIRLRDAAAFVLLASTGVFIHQWLQVSALQHIDAVSAGWLVACSPVFTVLLTAAFYKKSLSRENGSGMTAALTGIVLVASSEGFTSSSVTGIALMIASTLNWSVYSLLLKKLHLPYPAVVVAFYTSLLGSMAMVPYMIRSTGWSQLLFLPAAQWGHLLFLSIFVTAAAYWFWGKALSRLSSSSTASFLYTEPLFTLAAGAYMLKEPITFPAVAGGILILSGVYMMNLKKCSDSGL